METIDLSMEEELRHRPSSPHDTKDTAIVIDACLDVPVVVVIAVVARLSDVSPRRGDRLDGIGISSGGGRCCGTTGTRIHFSNDDGSSSISFPHGWSGSPS